MKPFWAKYAAWSPVLRPISVGNIPVEVLVDMVNCRRPVRRPNAVGFLQHKKLRGTSLSLAPVAGSHSRFSCCSLRSSFGPSQVAGSQSKCPCSLQGIRDFSCGATILAMFMSCHLRIHGTREEQMHSPNLGVSR